MGTSQFNPANAGRADFTNLFEELAKARGGCADLDARLDNYEQAISQINTDIDITIAPDISTLKASLRRLIDTGAKNMTQYDRAGGIRYCDIPVDLEAGTYHMYFGDLVSTDTDGTKCLLEGYLFSEGHDVIIRPTTTPVLMNRGEGANIEFVVNSKTDRLRIWAGEDKDASLEDDVDFEDAMVCTQTDYELTPKFVTFVPTLAALYQRVLDVELEILAARGGKSSLDGRFDATDDAIAAEATARQKTDEAVIQQINSGAKNRLKLTAVSRTHNGITFTVGDDGTVTANGTATANAYIQVAAVPGDGELFDGSYRLCGCPTGGSRETYAQYMALSNYARYDYGESVSLIPTGLTGNVNLVIMIYAGYTADNVVFKPMICKAVDYLMSPEHAPYCPTMPELYQMILALQSGGASLQSVSPNLMTNALNEAE